MPVDVELDVGSGIPSFSIVGLADMAVQEARERVRAAIKSAGFELPNARIVVNLAPGPLRKHGTGFDLPIALGLLTATRQLPVRVTQDALVVGELSLDGGLRGIPGIIAYALAAKDSGVRLIGPNDCASVVQIEGVQFHPVGSLADFRRELPDPRAYTGWSAGPQSHDVPDFADVVGQQIAVRALTIAAAGGHNVLMVGPPGSGKTMLARRLPGILPSLTDDQRVQTALVHSVGGVDATQALKGTRPFRAPHHSASIAGLVGGGTPPRPGEISLAHNGVLFMDEMPEFSPAAMQCLRQPLEDGVVTLVRAEGRVSFPAAFQLVGAANPCPCGFLGDPDRSCTCSSTAIERYRNRIGGPLMDRIDIVVHVERPRPSLLIDGSVGISSEQVRDAVCAARERSASETDSTPLSGAALLRRCRLDADARRSVERAASLHRLSGRGITRLLRVARTVADLDGHDDVSADHIAEATGYRAVGTP